MILKQFYLGCLAHASYLIGDETSRAAVVVDPQRDVDEYLARLGPGLTGEDVGKATVDLVSSAEYAAGAYLLTPAGLTRAG